MQPTRQEILDYLHRQGRVKVKELGRVLSLTPTGIRQHLTVLERDGLIRSYEERGTVGRPALVYTLTPRVESLFPKNYDQLAVALMDETRRQSGGDGLHTLLKRVANKLARPHMERVEGRPLAERAEITSEILREQGCLADTMVDGDDILIREYTCPYDSVARQNSAVCVLHVDFVSRISGGDVKLTTSLLRGDRACTYRIRPKATAAPETSEVAGSPRPAEG
ncbi:MAG: helix-turn-helix domain-containing protein [Dehalococcoidia bacterium]|nr:helix-turn-helix domain-containing protein [Dehalococcoidia bacterium]